MSSLVAAFLVRQEQFVPLENLVLRICKQIGHPKGKAHCIISDLYLISKSHWQLTRGS